MPFIFFYFVIFFAFGAQFCKKKIDESNFFPFMEKSFPGEIYFPISFPPDCLDLREEPFFPGLALLKNLLRNVQ